VERPRGPWLALARDGQELDMPIAHAEGRYYIDEESYNSLLLNAPVLRYLNGFNPNGSVHDIAGVGTEDGVVFGLMPHPERASEELLAPKMFSPGGKVIFESISYSLKRGW
jgi:phosphoribosylformylglycinamidine synthase